MNSNNHRKASACKEERQRFPTVKSMHVAASSRALLAYRLALVKDRLRLQDGRSIINPPLPLRREYLGTLPALPSHPSSHRTTTTPSITTTRPFIRSAPLTSSNAGNEEAPPCASVSRTALADPAPVPPFKNQQEGTRIMQTMTMQAVGGSESFPMVLHRALAELALVPGGTDIATFLPSGTSFQIRNQFLFVTHVLPFFFPNMKSFASFQRQLNLYNFKRITGAGVDRGAYRHDLFVREFPVLSSHMKRTKIKKGEPRRITKKSA